MQDNLLELISNNNNSNDLEKMDQTITNEDIGIEEDLVKENLEIKKQEDEVKENLEIKKQEDEVMLEAQVISLNSWVDKSADDLSFVERIQLNENSILNADNILLLKSIGDDEIQNIQLYKNTHNYFIFDLPCDHMKLFGEHGFYIRYHLDNGYAIKLYGTKTNVFITICVMQNNKLYPVYHFKSLKHKLGNYNVRCITHQDFESYLTDNRHFDLESAMIQYDPLSKYVTKNLSDNSTLTKRQCIEWMIDKNESIVDVSHSVKIDKVIIDILYK